MAVKKTKKREKKIRVGVIGVGRGQAFMKGAEHAGLELVAVCDTWKEKLKELKKQYPKVSTYTDYDRFLEHKMDAVVLANYFDEHAPFAIKALEAGMHVMSETSCNSTLAEGVALCEAVEKSKKIYMLAENYPYTKFNMEMRRVYQTGEIGDVTYAEGEYNHPMSPEARLGISKGMDHWRNWLPSTYYCTHALAPLMYITDTMPTKVSGHSICCPGMDDETVRVADAGSVIICRMDNGAIFRIFGLLLPGHSNWYRVHGTRGAMEITRGAGYFGPQDVRVWHEPWDKKESEMMERTYTPNWPEHGALADAAGHGGGDFWTNFEFANAIRSGKQPFLNVYRGVAMSSVGILAWKSALEEGVPFEMPDFKKKSIRKKYKDDHWSPFPRYAGPDQPPPSIDGFIKPPKSGVKNAKKVWGK